MSAEVVSTDLKRFLTMVESIQTGVTPDEVVIISSASGREGILVARGNRSKGWKISLLDKSEMPTWPEPEETT